MDTFRLKTTFAVPALCRMPDDGEAKWHYWIGKPAQLTKAGNSFFHRINTTPDSPQPHGMGRQEEILHGSRTILDPKAAVFFKG